MDSTKEINENSEANFEGKSDSEKNHSPEQVDSSFHRKASEDMTELKSFDDVNGLSEEDLLLKLKEADDANAILSREYAMYEFSLKENGIAHNILEATEMDEESQPAFDRLLLLSYPVKCYFARKLLEYMQRTLELEKSTSECDLQEFQLKLEFLNRSLNALKESMEDFKGNVRIDGRHPVTKKVILQKVARFFDDSIKGKMAMTNRCKIQIQSNVMENHKLLSQMKEQEKRLATLDLLKYQEAELEHEKSCNSLLKHKDQIAKCKSTFSSLHQKVAETKRSLEKEKIRMEKINAAVSKKEYMKTIMHSEKARNDQKVKDLTATMRKIKLDPRRHDLPEVSEYARVRRENHILKQNIATWKKKVELVEQAKRLHLSALRRKIHYR